MPHGIVAHGWFHSVGECCFHSVDDDGAAWVLSVGTQFDVTERQVVVAPHTSGGTSGVPVGGDGELGRRVIVYGFLIFVAGIAAHRLQSAFNGKRGARSVDCPVVEVGGRPGGVRCILATVVDSGYLCPYIHCSCNAEQCDDICS